MADKNKEFEVSELSDSALEDASGGAIGVDVNCPENTNCKGANCVSGCGGGGTIEQAT